MRCCVPGCGQRTQKGISFHKFPSKEPERLKEWVDTISKFLSESLYDKKSFAPKPWNVVCSKHFSSNAYIPVLDARPMLRASACPSIFLCDPNAKRQRRSKPCSTKVVTSTLCRIAPKPGVNIVGKITTTEQLSSEILDAKPNINEPAAPSTVALSPLPQSTSEWKPDCSTIPIGLDVPVKTEVCDDVSEYCTSCSSLRRENETLRAEIIALKESVAALNQTSSHSIEFCSTPTSDRVRENTIASDGHDSLSSLRKAVALDHRYEATPRTLKRKLQSSESRREIIAKRARLSAKKLERTQLKVAEMKQMMKDLVQKVDLRPEVATRIQKVFDRVPVELYKRSSAIRSAGKKKIRKVRTAPKMIQPKPEKRFRIN